MLRINGGCDEELCGSVFFLLAGYLRTQKLVLALVMSLLAFQSANAIAQSWRQVYNFDRSQTDHLADTPYGFIGFYQYYSFQYAIRSADGISWTRDRTNLGSFSESRWCIDFADGLYVAWDFFYGSRAATSYDGITYTSSSGSLPTGYYAHLEDFAHLDGVWVLVGTHDPSPGYYNAFCRSIDHGKTWSMVVMDDYDVWSDGRVQGVSAGGNLFVAVGDGRSYASLDGLIWSTSITGIDLRSVCYFKNAFYACGDGGIYQSTDGLNWNLVHSDAHVLRDIDSSSAYICAVGGDNRVRYSTDGENWLQTTVNSANSSLYKVCVGSGSWVVEDTSSDSILHAWRMVDVPSLSIASGPFLTDQPVSIACTGDATDFEFQFDWGEGSFSDWSSLTQFTHARS